MKTANWMIVALAVAASFVAGSAVALSGSPPAGTCMRQSLNDTDVVAWVHGRDGAAVYEVKGVTCVCPFSSNAEQCLAISSSRNDAGLKAGASK